MEYKLPVMEATCEFGNTFATRARERVRSRERECKRATDRDAHIRAWLGRWAGDALDAPCIHAHDWQQLSTTNFHPARKANLENAKTTG